MRRASVHFHGNYTVKPPRQSGRRVCARVQDVVGMNARADISVIKRLLLYPVACATAVRRLSYAILKN